MTMSDMKENQCATITDISRDFCLSRRLLDLGFMEGQTVLCTNIAAAGSPLAYELRGCKVALRKKDAGRIGVAM